MRPEAMANGNPLFMNCDFFREHVFADPEETLTDEISPDEHKRMADHQRECKPCIEWMIAQLHKDTLPSAILRDRDRRIKQLRANHTRLVNKHRSESSARRV